MILYYNPDVGSGIEYVGNIIKSWIDEIQKPYIEVKDQDHPLHLIQHFIKNKPDIVIVNEEFDSICNALSYYKLFFPKTKIIYIYHVWQNIVYLYQHLQYDNRHKQFLLELVDNIICVNYPPEDKRIPIHIKRKMYTAFMPMDPDIYKIKTLWRKRKNMFMYLGNIMKHKMSEDFLQKIQSTDITIDCYGKMSSDPDYAELFNSCKNVVHKGYVSQEKVSDVMNEYKFFVMPHEGPEPFNIAMLQAIMCGTIPLIVNDRNASSASWIDWAKDLYYSNNNVDEFIENLTNVSKEDDLSNAEIISQQISEMVNFRFDYKKFKKDFQNILINI